MFKIKIQTIKTVIFMILISFITFISLSLYINKLTPQYSVQSLKSAKITHLKNAYINTNSELVGLTKNRQQLKYTIPDDFKLNTSGNVSVYTFEQDYDGNIALSKAEYESTLKHSQKLEQEREPFSKLRKYSIVILIIFVIILFGACIDSKSDDRNIENK